MKLKILFIIYILLLIQTVNAQTKTPIKRPCLTKVPPISWDNQFNQKVEEYKNTSASNKTQSVINYTIPVIVHVLHGGQPIGTFPNLHPDQIASQIAVLNADFAGTGYNSQNIPAMFANAKANTGITFRLALKDPNGAIMPEPGIDRINYQNKNWVDLQTFTDSDLFDNYVETTIKPQSIWDPNKYFNIWVSDRNNAVLIMGYATFPIAVGLQGLGSDVGSSIIGTSVTDGVWCYAASFGSVDYYPGGVYDSDYSRGRISTHEIGHWLGLRHISGDAVCGNDYCNDTPKQAGGNDNGQDGLNFGCPTHPFVSSNECPGTTAEMFMNFMDYTNDDCGNMFTNDQTTRMQTAMATAPYRNQLNASALIVCALDDSQPVASFDYNPGFPITGSPVQFYDLSTNSPTSWNWDFGDGGTSTDQSPEHTYATTGTYNVELTVSNANGSNTYSASVFVDQAIGTAPIANFDFTPVSGIVNVPVQFNDLSSNSPTSWYWDFGDFESSTDQSPNHSYNNSGSYVVSLTVSNDGGFDTFTTTIVVNDAAAPPIANFDIDTYYGNAPLVVNVNDLSTNNPTTWSWDFGDASSPNNQSNSSGPLTFTYQNAGDYVLSLTVNNSEGVDTYTTVVSVISATNVAAQFSADNYSGDAPLTVQFTDESTSNPTTWNWNFGDPSNPNNQSSASGPLSFTYQNPGDYIVSLTASDGTSTDTYTTTISVTSPTLSGSAAFSYYAAPPTAPVTVYFNDESTNSPSSWYWNFGNGEFSSDQNPSVTYAEPGNYIVSLQVDGVSIATQTIAINSSSQTPIAQFSVDVNQGNAPLTVNFTDLTSNNPNTWNWDFGNYTGSNEQNTSYTFESPGIYVVTLTADNTDGSSSYSTAINVGQSSISFTSNVVEGTAPLTVNFSDLSSNTTNNWDWDFGNLNDPNANSTNQNPSYTYTAAGTYVVKFKANIAGTNDSTTATINVLEADQSHVEVYCLFEETQDSVLIYDGIINNIGQKLAYPSNNNPSEIKICADGSTSTVIYLKNITVGNYSNVSATIANSSNEDIVGKITSVESSSITNHVRVVYKSPTYRDINHSSDILRVFAIGVPKILDIPIKFYDAPIVPVRDIFSKNDYFEETMKKVFNVSTQEDVDHYLSRSYYTYDADTFVEASAKQLKSGIEQVLRNYSAEGYICSRVILVGHGSGGIVSRYFIEVLDGKDKVHKLITVNTPHSGSAWMSFLDQPSSNVSPPLPGSYLKTGYLVRRLYAKLGRRVDAGGIYDLKLKSNTIQFLNTGDNCLYVPSHAITSTLFLSELAQSLNATEFGLLSGLADFNNSISKLFAGKSFYQSLHTNSINGANPDVQLNDFEVALASQQGGLSTTTNFANVSHSNVLKDNAVLNKILFLIRSDPDNVSIFSKSGFSPVAIDPNPNYSQKTIATTYSPSVGGVKIVSPNQNLLVNPGDNVPVVVSSWGARKYMYVGITTDDNSLISRGNGFAVDSATKFLSFIYKVPQDYCGNLKIAAIAYDSLGYSLDSLDLIINTNNLVLDSISVNPKNLVIIKNKLAPISVTGYFAGVGPVSITNMDNIAYSSSNDLISTHMGAGLFKGKHIGSTAATVFYKGKTKQIQLKVVDSLNYVSQVNSVKENAVYKNQELLALKLYPNPTNDLAYVQYTLNDNDLLKMDILDLNGKLIKTVIDTRKTKGSYTLAIDCNDIISGMYIIKAETKTKIGYTKLVVFK